MKACHQKPLKTLSHGIQVVEILSLFIDYDTRKLYFSFSISSVFLYLHRNFKINLQRMKQGITISLQKLVVGTILREKKVFTSKPDRRSISLYLIKNVMLCKTYEKQFSVCFDYFKCPKYYRILSTYMYVIQKYYNPSKNIYNYR